MLTNLSINNYALIGKAEIELSPGFTIITGETGAGKSILIGALSLLLGERADTSVGTLHATSLLSDANRKCVVEGSFQIGNYGLESIFQKNDLDYEDSTIIRREINAAGKSRAFVNDTPVNLTQLKEIAVRLVDVHSQHQKLLLHNPGFQLSVVDAFANHKKLLEDYQSTYSEYKSLGAKLEELVEMEKTSISNRDYFSFQLQELEALNLRSSDLEDLEARAKALNHSEEISAGLSEALALLDRNDVSVLKSISEAKSTLANLVQYQPNIEVLSERMASVYIEIKDITSELESLEESTGYDPAQVAELTSRLDDIYRIQHKHGVNSITALSDLKDEFEEKLQKIEFIEEDIADLRAKVERAREQLEKLSITISDNRKKVLPAIEDQIKSLLSKMAMPNANLIIELTETEDFTPTGKNKIQFLFKANKGGAFCDLHKVASGGELSRLMLAIKASIAELMSLPTIIFDEIDTGISGETADKVGAIMQGMAQGMQVITITHLPQIASKAENHFRAYKTTTDNDTKSEIKLLSQDERIDEIAKMLSGEELSSAAVSNAKELLHLN